jgi:hypothetical protein
MVFSFAWPEAAQSARCRCSTSPQRRTPSRDSDLTIYAIAYSVGRLGKYGEFFASAGVRRGHSVSSACVLNLPGGPLAVAYNISSDPTKSDGVLNHCPVAAHVRFAGSVPPGFVTRWRYSYMKKCAGASARRRLSHTKLSLRLVEAVHLFPGEAQLSFEIQ